MDEINKMHELFNHVFPNKVEETDNEESDSDNDGDSDDDICHILSDMESIDLYNTCLYLINDYMIMFPDHITNPDFLLDLYDEIIDILNIYLETIFTQNQYQDQYQHN